MIISGECGITCKVIADSISPINQRILTLQLRYPRFIHPEFMTHRVFSRNASSNRAIPTSKILDQVQNDPAMPVYWGSNIPGMQAGEEVEHKEKAKTLWRLFANSAAKDAQHLSEDFKLHKQIANRVLEPFQFINVIVTSTEWKNFFSLRCHPDAQPEIQELADCMETCYLHHTPIRLDFNEWHLPYITLKDQLKFLYLEKVKGIFYDRRMISAARCARVSYNRHDGKPSSFDEDIELAKQLLESRHMSPFEHIARPVNNPKWVVDFEQLDKGVTHMDRKNNSWSGNFREWIQFRQILNNNNNE